MFAADRFLYQMLVGLEPMCFCMFVFLNYKIETVLQSSQVFSDYKYESNTYIIDDI